MRLEWHSGCDILGRIEKVVTEVVSVFWGSGDTPPPIENSCQPGADQGRTRSRGKAGPGFAVEEEPGGYQESAILVILILPG